MAAEQLGRVSGDEQRDGGIGQGSWEATPGLGLFSEEHGGPWEDFEERRPCPDLCFIRITHLLLGEYSG